MSRIFISPKSCHMTRKPCIGVCFQEQPFVTHTVPTRPVCRLGHNAVSWLQLQLTPVFARMAGIFFQKLFCIIMIAVASEKDLFQLFYLLQF